MNILTEAARSDIMPGSVSISVEMLTNIQSSLKEMEDLNRKAESKPGKKGTPKKKGLFSDQEKRLLARYSSLGVEFAGVIALFSFFGYEGDQYFGTMPWLTLTGFFIAFLGMTYLLIKDLGNWN